MLRSILSGADGVVSKRSRSLLMNVRAASCPGLKPKLRALLIFHLCYRSPFMPFDDLQQFLHHLEQHGQLKRIRAEVDPELEVTEITQRVIREDGPALLFENPKGSPTPLLMNLFGSMQRVKEALGGEPAQIGLDLYTAIQKVNPPTFKGLWESKHLLPKALAMRPKTVRSAISQEIVEAPDLDKLPVLKCWPGDAGRFITYGMVLTHHPRTHRRNLGLYRLQVFDSHTTGMHWQSMKGGRGHYWEAEQQEEDLEVAVAIGADPILMMAAILPLPEDVDEIGFAGFLRGKAVPMAAAKTLKMLVPAKQRRIEGPFGDHFGHYSEAAEFPVFQIHRVTRRKKPVYAATVVGKP